MVDCRYQVVLLPSSLALGYGLGVTFHLDEAFGDVRMGLRFCAVAWVGMELRFLAGNRALLAGPMFSSAS